MTTRSTDDVKIKGLKPLIAPAKLMAKIPLKPASVNTVLEARQGIVDILKGRSDRLLVVVGPCSIHDVKAALEYAKRLKQAMKKYQNELQIVMRVYFEKPRTGVGWKGLINDPHLDNSFDINVGLAMGRQLLSDITSQGVPAAVEFLDTITPQYFSDLVSWGAIGARTTESQVHRQLASGLSMPIGFKNATDGNVRVAIEAVEVARHPHHFLSVTKSGETAIVTTLGNSDCHVVLRGSNNGTNYDEKSIIKVAKQLDRAKLIPKLMVDCSHGNSQKDHTRQHLVVQSVAQQIAGGSNLIAGVMIESHLHAGKQTLVPGKKLAYGVSITYSCVDWDETVKLLKELAEAVETRRKLVNDNDSLAQVRQKIDAIDQSLVALIIERAKQAQEVAKVKRAKNKHAVLYRPEREAVVIRRVLEKNIGPISDEQMESIFREIMNACLAAEE